MAEREHEQPKAGGHQAHAAPGQPKQPERAKLTDEEKQAGVAAYAPPEPEKQDRAERTKAEKAREKDIAGEKFIANTHLSGGYAPGDVVERTKLGRFVNDKGEHDREAYDANIGRLLDLGAISPAPKEEEEK